MTLTIIFVGLIAFVPSPSTDSYWALLVNAREGALAPACIRDEGDPDSMDHIAYLVLPESSLQMDEDLCPCTGELPASPKLLGNNVSACVYKLKGYDISLEVMSTDKLTVATGAPRDTEGFPALPYPSTPAEKLDLAWTRSVEEGTGTREKVRDSCLATNPVDQTNPPICDLAGRLRIQRGRVETECIVPHQPCTGGYVLYDWVKNNQPPPLGNGATFGEGVRLQIDNLSGSGKITLRKFADTRPFCELPLKTTGNLEAFVTNQAGTSPDVLKCETGAQTPHPHMYRYFYKLIEPQGSDRDCVYPTHVCAPLGYPRCPGAVLSE